MVCAIFLWSCCVGSARQIMSVCKADPPIVVTIAACCPQTAGLEINLLFQDSDLGLFLGTAAPAMAP